MERDRSAFFHLLHIPVIERPEDLFFVKDILVIAVGEIDGIF